MILKACRAEVAAIAATLLAITTRLATDFRVLVRIANVRDMNPVVNRSRQQNQIELDDPK
jgi:hypothetical protein